MVEFMTVLALVRIGDDVFLLGRLTTLIGLGVWDFSAGQVPLCICTVGIPNVGMVFPFAHFHDEQSSLNRGPNVRFCQIGRDEKILDDDGAVGIAPTI